MDFPVFDPPGGVTPAPKPKQPKKKKQPKKEKKESPPPTPVEISSSVNEGLVELLAMDSEQLYALAQEKKLAGRGSMKRDDLIIELSPVRLGPEAQNIIRMSSKELQELAREEELPGYSKMRRHELIIALLPENPSPDEGDFVYAIRWPRYTHACEDGEIVGYCFPSYRPGIMTILRQAGGDVTQWPDGDRYYRAHLLSSPPPSLPIKETPL